MEERVPEMAPMEGVTAQGLTDQLLEEENMQLEEEGAALEAEIREAIGELFEDGWTGEELRLLAEDEAAMYLRRMIGQTQRAKTVRRSLPVMRSTAAGSVKSSGIDQMTDAQFDAFSRQAREAAMMGRKIRM